MCPYAVFNVNGQLLLSGIIVRGEYGHLSGNAGIEPQFTTIAHIAKKGGYSYRIFSGSGA